MGAFGRSRKKLKEPKESKEDPKPASADSPIRKVVVPTAGDEVRQVLELIRKDATDPEAIRKRRASKEGNSKESTSKMKRLQHRFAGCVVDSQEAHDEAEAINQLIRQANATSGGAIRERRKNKGDSNRSALDPAASTARRPSNEPSQPHRERSRTSAAAREVSQQKVVEDRQIRTSSERDGEIGRTQDKAEDAKPAQETAEAPVAREQHDTTHEQEVNQADSRARGTAKAAAKLAHGVFHTLDEWQSLVCDHREKVETLERKVAALTAALAAREELACAKDTKAQVGSERPRRLSFSGKITSSLHRLSVPRAGFQHDQLDTTTAHAPPEDELPRSTSAPFRRRRPSFLGQARTSTDPVKVQLSCKG